MVSALRASTDLVSVISNTVHTYYDSATGIDATAVNGNVSVINGFVFTNGIFSDGVFASAGGNAFVNSYMVKTYGEDSAGIVAESNNGNTVVDSVFVYTKGAYSDVAWSAAARTAT